MEDGLAELQPSDTETQESFKNGVVPAVMASFPEGTTIPKQNKSDTLEEETKFNGDVESSVCEDEYSSESDALVIDESIPKKTSQKRKRVGRTKSTKKQVKESEVITHSNPFFNESLYELSQQHQILHVEKSTTTLTDKESTLSEIPVGNCKVHKHKKGKNKSPKREYAQYLGLQPTVQFKCSKCGQAGFETLTTLNEHILQCDAIPAEQPPVNDNVSSSFKLTRKVFLCSACGTYYENWNLYLHMLELHRRFICLYCLGMFSAPNDLCQHIQARHNLQPGHKNSLDEFFSVYSEPCYVVCCECNKLFNEEDNFFYHNCVKSGHTNNNKSNPKVISKIKPPKVPVRPENHVTGDSGTSPLLTGTTAEKISSELEESNNKDISKEDDNNKSNHSTNEDTLDQETVDSNYEEPIGGQGSCRESPVDAYDENTQSQGENTIDTSEKQMTVEDMEVEVSKELSNNNFKNLTICDKLSENYTADEIEENPEIKTESISEAHSEDEQDEDSLNFTEDHSCDTSGDNIERESPTAENIQNSSTDCEENVENSQQDNIIHNEEREESLLDSPVPKEETEEPNEDRIDETGSTVEEQGQTINKEADHISDNELDKSCEQQHVGDNYMEGFDKIRPISVQGKSEIMETSANEQVTEGSEQVETRKVPKLSLKLPKRNVFDDNQEDSEDSEKLTMEVNQVESESEANVSKEPDTKVQVTSEPQLQVAGQDVNVVELQLEQPLDKFELRVLLQKCLSVTAPVCIYCNHARKIAVNGKQLALHAIAEHRYSAVVNSITAEELMPETFVARIKESMNELENIFFSLDSGASDEGITFSHIYECFQCRYSTAVHKELYLHNRKMHTKNLLLCIMCKSNFYSYSELICHLCPGQYVLDYDIQFHCCMCVSDDLPSAFRLMVHLRKRHHVCDVCLELCHNQYKLSNHVWKHKLHHFCYRCGIAYRNKPDITRHLFWKHGTESVLCKKCLQKKWPHVYHFCVPPTSFLCEECNLTFTRAVSLKVHKRIHSDNKPHVCSIDDCQERFISKKLLAKHELKHQEPVEEPKENIQNTSVENESVQKCESEEVVKVEKEDEEIEEKPMEKPKPKIDVYDLPELNLSESDSDSEDEVMKKSKLEGNKDESKAETETSTADNSNPEHSLHLNILENITEHNSSVARDDESEKASIFEIQTEKINDFGFEPSEKIPPILENIWDDFKNYQAEKHKIGFMLVDKEKEEDKLEEPVESEGLTASIVLLDHDYCVVDEPKADVSITEVKPDLTQRVDHDYCSPKGRFAVSPTKPDPEKPGDEEEVKKSPKKPSDTTSSDSSSGSDSSSCTCGSNCSCSSSSGSSSSSSDSSDSDSSTEEGRKKQQLKRERRRERAKAKKSEIRTETTNELITVDQPAALVALEMPIQESDLDTTESETDEEFYDKQPQKLAKKMLEEKRNQLLAEMGPVSNDTWLESSRPTTPSLPEVEKPKKKSKSKKKKKRKNERKEQENQVIPSTSIPPVSSFYQLHQPPPTVAPLTLTISRNSPVPSQAASIQQPVIYPKLNEPTSQPKIDDSHLRASKRRRVPNKFYGYSSDEESEKGPVHAPKWRKTEIQAAPQSPLTVPPITIKTAQIAPPPLVEPLTIRPATQTRELQVLPRTIPPRPPPPKPYMPPVLPPQQHHRQVQHQKPHPVEESGSDSNDSSSEENHRPPESRPAVQPQLYCYCRCPYDEVSEMIGCDANDCEIEWFHFECVGIMVPPRGQWFCPDCRKKKQQKRELLQT